MRNTAIFCSLFALAAVASVAAADWNQVPAWGPDQYGGYASTHIVVKLYPGIDPANLPAREVQGWRGLLKRWRVSRTERLINWQPRNPERFTALGLDRYFVLRVPQGTDTVAMAADAYALGNLVELAEVDGIGGTAVIPNDPNFPQQWNMNNTGQVVNGLPGVVDADVDATEAWDLHTGTGNVTLAIIDSGVDPHTDFGGRLLPGWNTVTNNTETSDGCPHATHVAGIAGASGNNGSGVAGMNWGVQMLPIKVLTGCSGNETDCAEGIIWATDNSDAKICTMSLQYYTGIQAFADAVQYAHDSGLLLIAASGNNATVVAYPAKFPFCMAIGATTNRDTIASFSNQGPEVDVAAPGQDIYSTWVGNSYTYESGTSMATPLVSGLAALMWSYNPSLTNDDIESILKDTAEDKGAAGFDNAFGWGRVNAFAAMQAAGGAGPTTVPCSAITGMRAICFRGTLRIFVILADSTHAGEVVQLAVNGVPQTVFIQGRVTQLNLPGQSGTNTIEMSDPPACRPTLNVTCN